MIIASVPSPPAVGGRWRVSERTQPRPLVSSTPHRHSIVSWPLRDALVPAWLQALTATLLLVAGALLVATLQISSGPANPAAVNLTNPSPAPGPSPQPVAVLAQP